MARSELTDAVDSSFPSPMGHQVNVTVRLKIIAVVLMVTVDLVLTTVSVLAV